MADSLVQRALVNLAEVSENPESKLDAGLLERVRRESVVSISDSDRASLIGAVVKTLQNIQQDPSPATKLAEVLVEPYSFSTIIGLDAQIDLVTGLRSPSAPIQLLVLRLLSLAAKHVGDVGIVAANPDLVATLVDQWLRTTDVAVAESARQVISSLALAELKNYTSSGPDSNSVSETTRQGLMERRLFKDKDVYNLFFSLPSFRTTGKSGQLSKRDKTLAQGRLLDLIKEIWPLTEVWHSQLPEVERNHTLGAGEGLIHFAALHMIDKTDVLLRVTQIEFYTDLIKSMSTEDNPNASSQLLEFLTSTGIHDEIVSVYANPETQDPLDITFHYAPAARYVAAFALAYYEHFMSDTTLRSKVFKRLHEVLDIVPNSQWARNDGPAHDLHVLVSVPRLSIVTDPILIFALPTIPASADVFRTLAQLFSGRVSDDTESLEGAEVITYPTPQITTSTPRPWQQIEQWSARYLFLQYLNRHRTFWTDIISASGISAFRDTSLAAISILQSIIQADWQTDPGLRTFNIDLSTLTPAADSDFGWYGTQPPANGIAAVIHPQVVDVLLPFIMKGPEGRGVALLGSDTESAAYHIARAKMGLSKALEDGISEAVGRLAEGTEEKAMLTELAAGLAGLRLRGFERRDEAGAEVGTMEL